MCCFQRVHDHPPAIGYHLGGISARGRVISVAELSRWGSMTIVAMFSTVVAKGLGAAFEPNGGLRWPIRPSLYPPRAEPAAY